MIELLVFGALAFAAVLVLSVLGTVLAALFGLLLLPFQILGFLLKGLGFLIALPFILLGSVIGAIALGVGVLALFTPLLPFVLLATLVWLLVRRRSHAATA